jgi:hypothetical protein
VLSSIGPELRVIAQREEGVLVGHGLEDDIPSLASDSAVGSSPRDIRLPPEADAAAAPVAALHEDLDSIDEHGSPP